MSSRGRACGRGPRRSPAAAARLPCRRLGAAVGTRAPETPARNSTSSWPGTKARLVDGVTPAGAKLPAPGTNRGCQMCVFAAAARGKAASRHRAAAKDKTVTTRMVRTVPPSWPRRRRRRRRVYQLHPMSRAKRFVQSVRASARPAAPGRHAPGEVPGCGRDTGAGSHERRHGLGREVLQQRAAAGEDVVAVERDARVGRGSGAPPDRSRARVREHGLAAGQARERPAGADDEPAGGECRARARPSAGRSACRGAPAGPRAVARPSRRRSA